MTVYFITRKDRQDMVKIGYSENLQVRLFAIATSFPEGIELLATVDGGREVEKAFHKAFERCRVEGEWFKRTREIDLVIRDLGITADFTQTVFTPKTSLKESGSENDQDIARDLLIRIMHASPSITVSQSLANAYDLLSATNPKWTRRRVRAIWERVANRIDHFEVRNLLEVIENIQSTQRRAA